MSQIMSTNGDFGGGGYPHQEAPSHGGHNGHHHMDNGHGGPPYIPNGPGGGGTQALIPRN
jgi:uncharacterized membrane protein